MTLSTEPTVVTMVIGPSVAPLGTVALICCSLVTVKVAAVPLKRIHEDAARAAKGIAHRPGHC